MPSATTPPTPKPPSSKPMDEIAAFVEKIEKDPKLKAALLLAIKQHHARNQTH